MLRTLAEVLALRRPVLLGGPCGRALWTGRPRSDTDNMKPLEGVRILDLTRVLAGPFATMNLGDLGAEVIKVERPGAGDDTRTWGPPFVDTESIYFLSVNRNKKSIAVNMKDPKGVRIIKELAAVCDVLVENYVPGKLSKMGLGYEDIDKIAPHIVYCSITGYGQTGPMSQRAGYDAIASAISGLMHITGPEDGDPVRPGVAMTDLATGLFAYGAIMAGLIQQYRTGKGLFIDCNLLSAQVACLTQVAANYLIGQKEAKRWGTAHGSIVPYQAFKTKDGYLVIGAGNNQQFATLCKILNLPELTDDSKYKTNHLRVQNRKELIQILSARIAEETTAKWLCLFEGSGIPYGPINSMKDVFSEPQGTVMNKAPDLPSFKVQSVLEDTDVVYKSDNGHVIKLNIETNATTLLLENTTFVTFKASRHSVSPDLKYVLLAYDVKQIFHYSFTASYLIYNIHTREVWELNPPEVEDSVLQYAAWGVQGQQLIYIFENNIYYQPDIKSSSLRLTSSGKEGIIFNGIADWLYEEEILHSHIAHWWSPDGERLAFLMINDSLVPNMVIPRFTGALYPKAKQYPYPKAGQVNPTVKLYVVNLYGPTHTLELMPPDIFKSREYYITMVKWVSNTRTVVRWLNRPQNISILTVCESTTGACSRKYEMTSDNWLSKQNEEPVFSRDGSKFFMTVPVKQGGRGEFHHIAMFLVQSKSEQIIVRHLTSGNWEVIRILAYDETTQKIYFLSTESSSRGRQLYSASTEGLLNRDCISCNFMKEHCTYFDASFSPMNQHFLLFCEGPRVPMVSLHSTDNPAKYFILESNSMLTEAIQKKKLAKSEIKILHTDDYELPLQLSFPKDFMDRNQYALLLIMDEEPGGQLVTDKFHIDWDSVLIDTNNVIVARFDGRGSGFQGLKVLQEIHRRIGSVEAKDQVAAVKYLLKQPYIDSKRLSIYGKGYGGYIASMILKSDEKLFKCGAVVAPISDMKLYASAFSERYLGMPSKEESTYQASSVLNNIHGLKEENILLIHGTADRCPLQLLNKVQEMTQNESKVHFQHSAEFIKHLIKAGVNYTMQVYPDEGHYISEKSKHHFYSTILRFFSDCLKEEIPVLPQEPEEDE